MSLPQDFDNAATYFEECLNFLNEYKWIFCSSNTKFLKENIFEIFPNEWKNFFRAVENVELNSFPDGSNDKEKLPESLRHFQEKLQKLKPLTTTSCFQFDCKLMKGMSPKKSHEIFELSKFITNKLDNAVNLLIDFGSGLGYLSEALFQKKNFRILGLECDPQRVKMAKKRQQEYYPKSLSNVVYETLKVTLKSGKDIKELTGKYFSDLGQCAHAIVGLHACGDLSITAMDLFLTLESVKNLIIMPCCYHKLELSEISASPHIFKNFPLSAVLIKAVNDSKIGFDTLNRPFLRLACQQTASRWRIMTCEDHHRHGMEMFARAVAECLVQEDEKITKRKNKKSSHTENIYEYITEQYCIQKENQDQQVNWTEEHIQKVNGLLEAHHNQVELSEGLTCLQTALQLLCENIVLYDRVCYLKERALTLGMNISVDVKTILKDDVSPRCFVFVAEKFR